MSRITSNPKRTPERRLPPPPTVLLLEAALAGLGAIYRSGYRYQKAGVMLLELSSQGTRQLDQLETSDSDALPGHTPDSTRRGRLFVTLDQLNRRLGRGTVRLAAKGVRQGWTMRRERASPGYTTCWMKLARVPALYGRHLLCAGL